jgi:hypothetical protein
LLLELLYNWLIVGRLRVGLFILLDIRFHLAVPCCGQCNQPSLI